MRDLQKTAPPKKIIGTSTSERKRNPLFHNEELESKTAAIQREYDELLNEMLRNRTKQAVTGDDEGFYFVMNDYIREFTGSKSGAAPPTLRKHSSPTKRLIKMKNTAFSHKKVMKDNGYVGDPAQ